MTSKKKNTKQTADATAEKRAEQARSALAAARDSHAAAVEAEAKARAAEAHAQDEVRKGTASGNDLASAIHAVTAAELRVEGAADELEQAEKAHRVATAESLALELSTTAAAMTPAADLRRELAASITPTIAKATEAALAHNRKVTEAERLAREAELYDVGAVEEGITAAEHIDPFAPLVLESAHPTAPLLLHGKRVERLNVEAVVQRAVKRAMGDALTSAGLPVPDSLRVATSSPSIYAVDSDTKADVLALAGRMLTEQLPKHYRVEVLNDGETVSIPELADDEILVRIGYVEARHEQGGIKASMRLAAYHRDGELEPDSHMQNLGNWGKHHSTGRPRLVETQVGPDLFTGGTAATPYRVDLSGGLLADWGTLELTGVRFKETLPPVPAPSVDRSPRAGLAPAPTRWPRAPGCTVGLGATSPPSDRTKRTPSRWPAFTASAGASSSHVSFGRLLHASPLPCKIMTAARTRPRFRAAIITTVAAVVLLAVGLACVAIAYGTEAAFPIPGIGNYNVLLGVGLAVLSAPAGIAAIILWIVAAVRPLQP